MSAYLDDQGHRVSVGARTWYQAFLSFQPGSTRPLIALPPQPTREEAQADLDAYAKRQGWRVAE